MDLLRYFTIILLFFGSFAYSQDFLPNFGGVPLSPDIVIDSDGVSSFEVAEGRIAEVRGHSVSSSSVLIDFYRGVLPSLGWVESSSSGGDLYFVRDDEALWIDFGVGSAGEVLFRLGPPI